MIRWIAMLLLLADTAWAIGPVFSDGGPDAEGYGKSIGYPAGPRAAAPLPQNIMVGHFSGFGDKYRSHLVAKPDRASVLRYAATELTVPYQFRGQSRDLEAYLADHPATGFLIARGDTILFEHYQYGRTDKDKFLSQSMAKTITAMLVGIALREKAIASVDDLAADYVPELKGTEYGATPIKALLRMASGVAFKEVYDTQESDNAKLSRALFAATGRGPARDVAMFDTRAAPPSTVFRYAGAETEVLGLIVARSMKMSLAEAVRTRIWQPMGAEADARWTVDYSGQETAYCCFNAVLRDWARLALTMAHDGAWNGQQILPAQWVRDMTTALDPFQRAGTATPLWGYGYQTWLLPGPRRQFAFRGINGQTILVDPDLKLVLVHTAVRRKSAADATERELIALWNALVAQSM